MKNQVRSILDSVLESITKLKVTESSVTTDHKDRILKMFSSTENDVVDTRVGFDPEVGELFVVECDNSNPTYLGWLDDKLRELEDEFNVGFEVEGNDNGFYGKTYSFYYYVD